MKLEDMTDQELVEMVNALDTGNIPEDHILRRYCAYVYRCSAHETHLAMMIGVMHPIAKELCRRLLNEKHG